MRLPHSPGILPLQCWRRSVFQSKHEHRRPNMPFPRHNAAELAQQYRPHQHGAINLDNLQKSVLDTCWPYLSHAPHSYQTHPPTRHLSGGSGREYGVVPCCPPQSHPPELDLDDGGAHADYFVQLKRFLARLLSPTPQKFRSRASD